MSTPTTNFAKLVMGVNPLREGATRWGLLRLVAVSLLKRNFPPMSFFESAMSRSVSALVLVAWVLHMFSFFLIFSFSSRVREVSHKINGLRSLSIGQLLSLKSDALSALKQESKNIVACRCKGDNLLCSDKNCCFFVILHSGYTYSFGKSSSLKKTNSPTSPWTGGTVCFF